MGFDVCHLNLHKTFSTPHGGGGPGAGPVGVSKRLMDFLPVPLVKKTGDAYAWDYDVPKTIGKVKAFYGNISVLLKAYCYIRTMGASGLKAATCDAVLNANYLKKWFSEKKLVPYDRHCMHEFVISTEKYKDTGVHSVDVGKRLLDHGVHAPTVAFPLIVHEALMIEPTETESKETLDAFTDIFSKVLDELENAPDMIKKAPHTMPVKRLDDVYAARFPNIQFGDCLRKENTDA
jgi:glycine dehydrogenase subunit 2